MPIFDVLVCLIREYVAAMKVKKNPGKPGNFWFGTACSYRYENPTEFKNLSFVCEVILRDCRKAFGMLTTNNV